MTVDQIIEAWKVEKQQRVPSRFPCRAIMVNTIAEYCDLVDKMKKIPGVQMVTSEQIFTSADVLPSYENLTDLKYKDKWLILPGVSEYLRLFSRSEVHQQRFTRLWRYMGYASDIGRVLIPLWGCNAQWHDKDLHLDSDERQKDFFFDCTTDISYPQRMDVLVLSKQFDKFKDALAHENNKILVGVRNWYEYWAAPTPQSTEQVVITGRLRDMQSVNGDVSIKVVPDTLTFVHTYLQGGDVLTHDNCPTEAADLLFEYALQRSSLEQAILDALNVAHFQKRDIMSKWTGMSMGQKQLALLWIKLHQDDDYLSFCVRTGKNVNNLIHDIYHNIFSLRLRHPSWEKESQDLMMAIGTPKDREFFRLLDEIPDYHARLDYLTGATQDERTYLIHMVGEWMRIDVLQVMACDKIQEIYPALFAYLSHSEMFKDSDFERYFDAYKTYKLSNRLPEDEEIYFSDFDASNYPYRYTLLSDSLTEDSVVLWIDALGAEWLSLLCWTLTKSGNGQIKSVGVAQACLPTETEYNDQWNKMSSPHDKMDKLDKLAHKGVVDNPSYYACIEEQFTFIVSITKEIDKLFQKYHRVIITGDHGTSRLAARFFHLREGAIAPAGSQVCSHGRYCLLRDVNIIADSNQVVSKDSNGNQYLIYKNYDHFKQSGFAAAGDDDNAEYGEIHGGSSPEELLVPVVVFESTHEMPLRAVWENDSIKFSMKKAKPVVRFNKKITNLQANLGSVEGSCKALDKDQKEWLIVFSEKKSEVTKDFKYKIVIVADGHIVDMPPLEIKPALGGGDFDL